MYIVERLKDSIKFKLILHEWQQTLANIQRWVTLRNRCPYEAVIDMLD